MVAIGCTGLIGSGKSLVCTQLAQRGAIVIDADEISHAVTAKDGTAVFAIVERFGGEMLDTAGKLDRERLAEIVFRDDAARADLEAIVHPLVERTIRERLDSVPPGDIAVVESPLLVETNGRERYGLNAVLIVDSPEDLVIDRLVRERSMSEDEAQARITAQASRTEHLRAADFIIMNMGSLDELAVMVDRAWEWMKSLSS